MFSPRSAPRFAFLTPFSFLILDHSGSGCLDVYSVEAAAASNVLQVDSSSEVPPRDPVHIASLALPTIHPDLRITGMSIAGQPASSPTKCRISTSPFALAPDAHIFLLNLNYAHHSVVGQRPLSHDRMVFCEIFLHARVLQSSLARIISEPSAGVDPRRLSWSEWGPKCLRVFCGRGTDPASDFETNWPPTYVCFHRLHTITRV